MNLSPNYYPNRLHVRYDTGKPFTGEPKILVLHLTEGSFNSAKGWLCNPASQASSTRIFAKTGVFETLVDPKDAPWTNGFRVGQKTPPTNKWVLENCWNKVSPNLFTISYEIEWFQSDGVIPVDSFLYKSLVHQAAIDCHTYGIPATREFIMGHGEIDPDGKPFCGKHIPWNYIIPAIAEQVDTMKRIAAGDHFPSEWAADAWKWGMENGITDGTNPTGAITREQVVTMLHRYENLRKNS